VLRLVLRLPTFTRLSVGYAGLRDETMYLETWAHTMLDDRSWSSPSPRNAISASSDPSLIDVDLIPLDRVSGYDEVAARR
jgi:hypothetical protein